MDDTVTAVREGWVGSPLRRETELRCSYWSRGYATTPDGRCLVGMAIGQVLASERRDLASLVPRLNGCFAVCLQDEDQIVVATDRFGSIPVYHALARPGVRCLSDDPWRLIGCRSGPPELDELGLLDLVHAGYVTGTRTLVAGVASLPPAAIARFDRDSVDIQRYWSYGYFPQPVAETDAIDALDGVVQEVSARCGRIIHSTGLEPVLTLSGGLDSRILAATLSQHPGLKHTAISYGGEGESEVQAAAQVARSLGIEHRFVAIGPRHFNEAFLETSVREVGLVSRFTCGTGARLLSGIGGGILIPGHTGDFVSGGHLPPHAGLVRSKDQLHRFIDVRHFRFPGSDGLLDRVLGVDRTRRFEALAESTAGFDMAGDSLGLVDRWNVENRQRRLILMELRAYEGKAPWILPFYDYALVDFFARIPHRLRVGQYLYNKVALQRLFVGDRRPLAEIVRIGKPLHADQSTWRSMQRLSWCPSAVGSCILAAWPALRGLRAIARGTARAPSRPDPVGYWFRRDPVLREYLREKVQSISLPAIDQVALLRLAECDRTPEEFLNRTLVAAITANECMKRAERVWRAREELP